MENELIIYGIIGLVILLLLIKLFKLPIKLMINGVIGVVLLYIVNLLGTSYGIAVSINFVTAIIAGVFGIPGVIALVIIQQFI